MVNAMTPSRGSCAVCATYMIEKGLGKMKVIGNMHLVSLLALLALLSLTQCKLLLLHGEVFWRAGLSPRVSKIS